MVLHKGGGGGDRFEFLLLGVSPQLGFVRGPLFASRFFSFTKIVYCFCFFGH